MAAVVVAAFHRQRVLLLMARWRRLFDMTPDEPIEGIRMSVVALSDEEILRRVREIVEGWLKSGGLTPITMRPSWGYLSLAHAEVQKKRKDAKEAKHKRKNLEREELEKRRRQQRHDGLLLESSPSPSLLASSSDDDESEVGRGTLDHLPDVRGMALGASASSPVFPGGGGGDASGPAIARPGAEADTPEARALGKRAVSLVGSTVEVEQAAVGATQLPPQRVEGTPESGEGRPAPTDMGAVPPPPPPPLQRRRDVVPKRLCPRSSRKRQGEVPTLAPRKSLKVSTGSTAQWVVEAQATIQRGMASARANPKELVTQGEATRAATEQAEEEPTPREAEAHGSDKAEAPSVAEATKTKVEAPKTSEAEATEVEASRTTEAEVAKARAPRTTEAEVAEAGAPGTTEAGVAEAGMGTAKPAA
ncbi:uncharacterized protein [Miscanthus floridulus]|uniref:uncharacterized protein n=1 Tax=Miscanthus floridulus TaxID=154761 RepID=UPI003459C584